MMEICTRPISLKCFSEDDSPEYYFSVAILWYNWNSVIIGHVLVRNNRFKFTPEIKVTTDSNIKLETYLVDCNCVFPPAALFLSFAECFCADEALEGLWKKGGKTKDEQSLSSLSERKHTSKAAKVFLGDIVLRNEQIKGEKIQNSSELEWLLI